MSVNALSEPVENKQSYPPGSLIYIGNYPEQSYKMNVIQYDQTHLEEKEIYTLEEFVDTIESPMNCWINIIGIHHVEQMKEICKALEIHPLLMEDVLNTRHRPKYQQLDKQLFIIMKMLHHETKDNITLVEPEHLTLLLGPSYVITFQEIEKDVFEPVRQQMRNNIGRVRVRGVDYLLYRLIDTLVDNYLWIVDDMTKEIEPLEQKIIFQPAEDQLEALYTFKQRLQRLRTEIIPVHEIIAPLKSQDSELIKDQTQFFMDDLHDHMVSAYEKMDSLGNRVSELLQVYYSSAARRMNEVMKVLTVVSTIFIPLTFLTGLYGMNFVYIPELKWHWGYFTLLLFMGVITVGMVLYFKRKRWF